MKKKEGAGRADRKGREKRTRKKKKERVLGVQI
jgi:hypothetical protein